MQHAAHSYQHSMLHTGISAVCCTLLSAQHAAHCYQRSMLHAVISAAPQHAQRTRAGYVLSSAILYLYNTASFYRLLHICTYWSDLSFKRCDILALTY